MCPYNEMNIVLLSWIETLTIQIHLALPLGICSYLSILWKPKKQNVNSNHNIDVMDWFVPLSLCSCSIEHNDRQTHKFL